MSRFDRRPDAPCQLWQFGKRITDSPATASSTSPLRKRPPRSHAPRVGRVTGSGRSP